MSKSNCLALVLAAAAVMFPARAVELQGNWLIPPSGVTGPVDIYDEDAFGKCYGDAVKPNLDPKSQKILEQACKRAATPVKWRELTYKPKEAFACEEECKKAGTYSRNAGECRVSSKL